jgi:Delta7-sterol 5-desaturase
MPLHLGIFGTIPGLFFGQIVLGMIMYYALAGASYFYVFVYKKQRYLPDEPLPDAAEMRKARRLSFWNIVGNAVLGTPFHYLIIHGYGKVYYAVADRGWAYYALSFFAFLAITETGVYWAHRWLHHPKLYRFFHIYHHEYRKPHPWASMAFHPVDSFLQAVPHYLTALFMPVHYTVYFGFVTFVMLWTYLIHDRISLVRLGIVNYTAHHTMHHIYNKYNFGQFLTIWDRIGGTHRDPKKETRYAVIHY